MARSDLVLKLIQAGLKCDGLFVRRIAETIAADEREKQHEVFAHEIEMYYENNEPKPDFNIHPMLMNLIKIQQKMN